MLGGPTDARHRDAIADRTRPLPTTKGRTEAVFYAGGNIADVRFYGCHLFVAFCSLETDGAILCASHSFGRVLLKERGLYEVPKYRDR